MNTTPPSRNSATFPGTSGPLKCALRGTVLLNHSHFNKGSAFTFTGENPKSSQGSDWMPHFDRIIVHNLASVALWLTQQLRFTLYCGIRSSMAQSDML